MNTNEPPARASTVTPATADGLEPLFSIETLAEYVRVPVVTIYRWRAEGKGPCAVRIGRHVTRAESADQSGAVILASSDDELRDAYVIVASSIELAPT